MFEAAGLKDRVYLDYNATTPLEPQVVASITHGLNNAWANPSSSSHLGAQVKQLINNARSQVGQMIEAPSSDILFTSGGTEANNLVLWTALEYFNTWRLGKEIAGKPHLIASLVEHDAVKLPLKYYEKQQWADIDLVPVEQTSGRISCADVVQFIKPNTCLISIMLANNETGVIMPIAEIASMLKDVNTQREKEGLCKIYLHTDAGQAIGKIGVDVRNLQVDYLTIVGHKFYGPRIGALYVRDLGERTTPLFPMLFGGGQEKTYRPGTENTAMIMGLGTAADLVVHNLSKYSQAMQDMRDLLEQLLQEKLGDLVKFNFRTAPRLPNTCSVSFRLDNHSGGDILRLCPNLLASTGAACHGTGQPSAVLIASGVRVQDARTSIRLSVGRETTSAQVELAVGMIQHAIMQISQP